MVFIFVQYILKFPYSVARLAPSQFSATNSPSPMSDIDKWVVCIFLIGMLTKSYLFQIYSYARRLKFENNLFTAAVFQQYYLFSTTIRFYTLTIIIHNH